MARRDNRQTIAASPTETSVFQSDDAGGTDGFGVRELLISCASDSANDLQYRCEKPADPTGEWATLKPGECFRLIGHNRLIEHVVCRGVSGAATGGVEVMRL
jgi:hypothetical protein